MKKLPNNVHKNISFIASKTLSDLEVIFNKLIETIKSNSKQINNKTKESVNIKKILINIIKFICIKIDFKTKIGLFKTKTKKIKIELKQAIKKLFCDKLLLLKKKLSILKKIDITSELKFNKKSNIAYV